MTKNFVLEIENLNKIYNSKNQPKIALRNINLNIEKGSFFGLLGPNGAGKSTLINILSTIVKKTSGNIKIGGFDLENQTKQAKMKIGIVPQEASLDPFFNVRETLEITAGYYGIPKNQRRSMEIIEALGLKDKIHNKHRTLSGGMKRRLLIAKALVHNPDIIILDEPTAGVDVELREQLWDYISELNKNGKTILLTTHYIQEAERLCNKIAVINNGEIIKNDTKDNIMSIIDKKQLIIKLARSLSEIPDILLRKYDVKIFDGCNLVFEFKKNSINIESVINDISTSNLSILDVTTKEPDLEQVFKYLIK